MYLSQDFIISEIEVLVPLHAELLGDEGLHWIVNGNNQPQSIEGGSSIELTESFRVGIEAFHYILLLSAVLLHLHDLAHQNHEQPDIKAIKVKVDELIKSLNNRFPDLEDDKKDEVMIQLQQKLEEINRE
jgi:hypothetical protein